MNFINLNKFLKPDESYINPFSYQKEMLSFRNKDLNLKHSTTSESNLEEEAQYIRDHAGVPVNETVGIMNNKESGFKGHLEEAYRIEILSYEDAKSIASSGSGAAEDPFIIEGKRFNNSENSFESAGIYINDPDGNYFININNCEIYGYQDEQIYLNLGAKMSISNSKIYSKGFGIVQKGGDLEILETHFSGLEKGGILASSDQKSKLIIMNSLFDSESNEWGISSKGIYTDGTGLVNISFSTVKNANSLEFIYIYKSSKLIFSNCYIDNISKALFRGNKAEGFISKDSIIKYLQISNTSHNSIYLQGESDLEISFCTIKNSAPDKRLILILNSNNEFPHDIVIHHCKFTDSIGSGKPGNECLEVFYGKNIEFHHNWVTECTEDAYELVSPQIGCSIHENVGDNVQKQIVDIYQAFGNEKEFDSHGGYVGTYIHHIYGNSFRDCAVRITDADGLLIHDIYASCGALYSVILEQRYGNNSKTPANCIILDPIINYAPNGSKLGLEGSIGPGNIFLTFSFGEEDIKIKNDLIFIKRKAFGVTTNNSLLTNISILKFLNYWDTFKESVIEWIEFSDNEAYVEYKVYTGLSNSVFQLEQQINNTWKKIKTFQVRNNGYLIYSNCGYDDVILRLILLELSLHFFNTELYFLLIILIILLFFLIIQEKN
ncbi:MAG: right-handed parallel beta-helix repeat-containing protein [Promethearchaeota archaeon]